MVEHGFANSFFLNMGTLSGEKITHTMHVFIFFVGADMGGGGGAGKGGVLQQLLPKESIQKAKVCLKEVCTCMLFDHLCSRLGYTLQVKQGSRSCFFLKCAADFFPNGKLTCMAPQSLWFGRKVVFVRDNSQISDWGSSSLRPSIFRICWDAKRGGEAHFDIGSLGWDQ